MRVTYNALVQKDVNSVLRRYDSVSAKLGDAFWSELTSKIEATALILAVLIPREGISVVLISPDSRITFFFAFGRGEFES